MADEALLKTKSTLDNRDFNKGVQQMKKEMKDLNKVSSDAFSAIGNALGVDVGKIQQISSALQGLGNKLSQTGQVGASAFGSIANAITPVAAGIAGLGLAAAIAAFKQLNAEADAFEATIQGGVIKAQTDAYLSTYRQALRDQSGVGEGFSGFRQTVRFAWNELSGAFRSGFDFDRMREATQLAGRAKEIATELYNIDLQRKENSVQISQIDAQIAQQREIISDATRSAQERSVALATAQQLVKDKMDLQLPLAERQRDLIVEYNGLTSTTVKEYDKEISAKMQVNTLVQQEAAEQRSLLRQQNMINSALGKQADAMREIMRLQEQMAASQEEMKNLQLPNLGGLGLGAITIPLDTKLKPPTNIEEVKVLISEYLGGGITIGISISESDIAKIQDITDKVKSMIQDMAVKIGESIGTLLGDLVTGGDAWSNFASNAIKAFGDMAIAIGKIAIEAGTGALGIKAALSLSETGAYIAIAAGVALVALGAAVKAGLANVASGNYSAGSGVSSGSYSAGSTGFDTKEVTVHVTGELRADGDQLVTVINNANRRRGYNT